MSIKLRGSWVSTLFLIFVYNFIYLNNYKLIIYKDVNTMNKRVVNILLCDEISTFVVDKVVNWGWKKCNKNIV